MFRSDSANNSGALGPELMEAEDVRVHQHWVAEGQRDSADVYILAVINMKFFFCALKHRDKLFFLAELFKME